MKRIIPIVCIVSVGALVYSGYMYWINSNKLIFKVHNEISDNVKHAPKEVLQERESIKYVDKSFAIALYKNQDLVVVEFTDGKASEPKSTYPENLNIVKAAKYFTYSSMPNEVISSMPFSKNMIFYSGLQSNISENEWIFLERDMRSNEYNLCLYNHVSKSKSILFNQNSSPDSKYAFKPIAWLLDGSTIVLEAIIFGSSTEHEGIWIYNLDTKEATQININLNYNNTPIISPDGRYLLYCATSEPKDIHVPNKMVFVYDLENKREVLFMQDNKSVFLGAEWVDK